MSAQGWEMHSACCPPPIIQPPTPQSAEGSSARGEIPAERFLL